MKQISLLLGVVSFLLAPSITLAASIVDFNLSPDWKSFIIQNNGAPASSIPITPDYGVIPELPSIFKQTDRFAYIKTADNAVYRLNLSTTELSSLSDLSVNALNDISPDETTGVWTGFNETTKAPQVSIINFDTGSKQVITLSENFSQVGSASFSPDGTQLVVPVARVDYGQISARLFLIDINSGVIKQVYETKYPNSYILIEGWKENTPIYQEKQIDADYYYGDGMVDPDLNE